MWGYILAYFIINIILSIIIWYALKPVRISTAGFFLAGILFGLVILVWAIIAFALIWISGATYTFGEIVEHRFTGVKERK